MSRTPSEHSRQKCIRTFKDLSGVKQLVATLSQAPICSLDMWN